MSSTLLDANAATDASISVAAKSCRPSVVSELALLDFAGRCVTVYVLMRATPDYSSSSAIDAGRSIQPPLPLETNSTSSM